MCPMCDRVTLDGELNPQVTNSSLSLKDIKKIFPQKFIRQLDEMYMCGNLGDPMMAPDCIEIFEYFREVNPKIYLSMNTNGGARKLEWWAQLAKVVNHVTFSIDGLICQVAPRTLNLHTWRIHPWPFAWRGLQALPRS